MIWCFASLGILKLKIFTHTFLIRQETRSFFDIQIHFLLVKTFFVIILQDWDACSVGCKFVFAPNKIPDATFDLPRHRETASILRSMESSQYYAENNIDVARR